MSGFLSRVAARAVGEAPRAKPRVPTTAPREVESPSSYLAEQAVACASPTAPVVRTEPEQTSKEPTARQASEPQRDAPVREPIAVIDTMTGEVQEAPSPSRERVLDEVIDAILARDADDSAVEAVAATPAPEIRIAQVASASQVSTVEPPAATRDEPPVRVHIGRLEVRANLQQQPAPPVLREEPRSEGLSLSDYLRGKRVSA